MKLTNNFIGNSSNQADFIWVAIIIIIITITITIKTIEVVKEDLTRLNYSLLGYWQVNFLPPYLKLFRYLNHLRNCLKLLVKALFFLKVAIIMAALVTGAIITITIIIIVVDVRLLKTFALMVPH